MSIVSQDLMISFSSCFKRSGLYD